MQVTLHTAKISLSKLIKAALDGEEMVIARGDKPVVHLVPVEGRKKVRVWHSGRQDQRPGPDFLKPMSEEDLAVEGRS